MSGLADELGNPPQRRHPAEQMGKGAAEIDPDGVTITNAVIEGTGARTDFAHVLALFNLDPASFEVVDETVRCTTWQQSKRLEDGDRDTVQLYSYSFRARCITGSASTIPAETVNAWRKVLMRRAARPELITAGDGGTYVILVADPQLGKKGTTEAVENWQRGVLAHVAAARRLGSAVDAVHVAFMGDETENVANNYGNQPHTIELNLSRQLELDFDLRVWTIDQALTLRKPLSASSVVSNHGEFTRNGSKEPVTTQNDNSSTHVARQVAKLFDALEPHTGRQIDWTIGDSHPGVTLNLSGVKCYFTHGHIEKGRGTSTETRTRSAFERQILGRTDELGDVDLWFAAHYHHAYFNEFEGRTLFGCPALEAERSSEYMLSQYGVWSPPGMLGLLVTRSSRRGWSHANVF